MSDKEKRLPIVYSSYYDMSLFGLERFHWFDGNKWGKIVKYLIDKSSTLINYSNEPLNISMNNIYEPTEVTRNTLQLGHTEEYLKKLTWSYQVAKIVEVWLVAIVPNFILDRFFLKRLRYHVGGTVMASQLALKHKWAINIGGGFHHASANQGMGFCVYADISIAIKVLKQENHDFKFLIIDLDAHQGNGHETDFKDDDNVFICDIYNESIFPHDEPAKKGIDVNVPLISYTKDPEYMDLLKQHLDECFENFEPNLIIYNSGTDSLVGDPLGRLSLTPDGIMERDELVFKKAKEKKCPIVMVTSGGYQKNNAGVIANSIWNLLQKGIIE